jgi:hypothetical protein
MNVMEKHRKMEERQREREIKIEFLLWLHDMEKPVPKPVPKAGPLFCMETKDWQTRPEFGSLALSCYM